jgi:hypothetical protein
MKTSIKEKAIKCTNLSTGEKNITKAIRRVLTEAGIWHFKHWGGPMSVKGIADILGIYAGRFLAIEVKKPGGKLSPAQDKFLQDVRRNGGVAFTAYGVEDVINTLALPTLL